MSEHIDARKRFSEAAHSYQDEEIVEYFTDPCSFCGQGGVVRVFPRELRLWKAGAMAQVAFARLSADERELLISGTHPKCWDDAFGDEE